MAESEDGQERSEQATHKRLEDSRKKGQVPRSKEVSTTVSLILGASILLLSGDFIIRHFELMFELSFTPTRQQLMTPEFMLQSIGNVMKSAMIILAPFFTIMLVAGVASALLFGGWVFSIERISPDFTKLNPLAGLKNLVSVRSFAELIKSCIKLAVVAFFAYCVIAGIFEKLMILDRQDLMSAMGYGMKMLAWSFLIVSSSLIIVALLDAPFQLWKFGEDMKMTKQEVKEESKEQEGKPEVKGKMREMQRRMSQGRMMSEIPKADVVITNPTHFAVALRYQQKNMRAPTVVAKGSDLIASQIRQVATAHRITVVASPALSRALYYTTEIDAEIPSGLYTAVAQVLAYVFQLKMHRKGKAERPKPLGRVAVPKEFQY